jgi:hypothetical protein
VRETVVAVPRKKRAVGDEEQAHRTRSHGQVEKAPSRSWATSAIHRSIEHPGRLPSQAHTRAQASLNERWPRSCRYYLSSRDEWAETLKRNSALRGRMTMC